MIDIRFDSFLREHDTMEDIHMYLFLTDNSGPGSPSWLPSHDDASLQRQTRI